MATEIVKRPILPLGCKFLDDNAQWTNRFEIKSETSGNKYIVAQHKTKRHFACSCRGYIRHRKCKHLMNLGLPCFEVACEPKKIGEKMKIEETVNHFVRVHFDDVGCLDGICVEAYSHNIIVLLSDGTKQSVCRDQIISVGPKIEYPKF